MDLALRSALVHFAHTACGGTLDDAFDLIDRLVAEHGVPTDDAALRAFMTEVDRRAASSVGG